MAHVHELIDFVSSVFIVHENRVLLIDHKKLKRWLPIGGHIELDEDPEQALFREIEEECGLEVEILSTKPTITDSTVKTLLVPNFMDIHHIEGSHQHIGLIYIGVAKSDKVTLAAVEHNAIRWFSADELDKPEYNISPSISFYCQEALKAAASRG